MSFSYQSSSKIILCSRSSILARIQTLHVAHRLKQLQPDIKIEFFLQESRGDQDYQTPLWNSKTKGVFTSDLRELLINKKVDAVVHSHKDLEFETHPQVETISILEREDQRDILFMKKETLSHPPKKMIIFTSSLRRIYLLEKFLKNLLPAPLQNSLLHFESIRGNIPTRLKKYSLSDGHCLVLAKAGIDRILDKSLKKLLSPTETDQNSTPNFHEVLSPSEILKTQEEIRQIMENSRFMVLPLSLFPNAAAQGGLAVEVRKGEKDLSHLFKGCTDLETQKTTLLERRILSSYGGGCHQRIGISCLIRPYGRIIYQKGMLSSHNEGGAILKKTIFRAKSMQERKILAKFKKGAKVEEFWPLSNQKIPFRRISFASDHPIPLENLWISRNESFPLEWIEKTESRILWAAGVKTWNKLAKRGLWIEGCSDGLGEQERLRIEELTEKHKDFTKLTHTLSKISATSRFPIQITYKLETEEVPDLRKKRFFFWKSGSQFDLITRKYPEILSRFHSCGPGLSFEYLQKRLKGKGRLSVFLSHQEWLQFMLQKTP